jgi:hypothetical protein
MENNRQKFDDLYSIQLLDLFIDIQEFLKDNAIVLLNKNNRNKQIDFIDMIYKNVDFYYNDLDGNNSDNEDFVEIIY